ncbi:MAG: hypothetical protein R2867_16600 [Caldilineaceae bacterium]
MNQFPASHHRTKRLWPIITFVGFLCSFVTGGLPLTPWSPTKLWAAEHQQSIPPVLDQFVYIPIVQTAPNATDGNDLVFVAPDSRDGHRLLARTQGHARCWPL